MPDMIGDTFVSGGCKYVLGMGAKGLRPYYLSRAAAFVPPPVLVGIGAALVVGLLGFGLLALLDDNPPGSDDHPKAPK